MDNAIEPDSQLTLENETREEAALVSGDLQEGDFILPTVLHGSVSATTPRHQLGNIEKANKNIFFEDQQSSVKSDLEGAASSIPLPTPTSTDYTFSEPRNHSSIKLARKSSLEALTQAHDIMSNRKKSYRKMIKTLADHLPHLKNVQERSRSDDFRAICYDYSNNALISVIPITPSVNPQDKRFPSAMALRNDVADDVRLRLIVVEELSSDLIESLGFVFGISPEFFEEHLLNSGWQIKPRKDDESGVWITSGMKKTYASIKWHRLVRWKYPESSAGPISWSGFKLIEKAEHGKFHYELRPKTNTLRRTRNLSPDLKKGRSTGILSLMPEKATVWSSEFGSCKFIVLLLDPLPKLIEERTPRSSAVTVDKTKETKPSSRLKSLLKMQISQLLSRRNSSGVNAISRNVGLSDEENADGGQTDQEEKQDTRIIRTEWDLVEDVFIRWPFLDYDAVMSSADADQFDSHIKKTQSSAMIFDRLLRQDNLKLNLEFQLAPIDLLFTIIHGDTSNVLKSIGLILTDIRRQALDDIVIQNKLLHWRSLLDLIETELQALHESVQSYASFILQRKQSTLHYSDTEPSTVNILVNNSLAEISSLRERTAEAYKSLMASISIVESKRGIAEAESVTKLTELAFLFIPLSFSASIFGMQVKELNPENISISAFFIMAIIVTSSSYVLRLFIRSAFFIKTKRDIVRKVRDDAKISEGDPISTRQFLTATWHLLLKLLFKLMPNFKVTALIVSVLLCALIPPFVVLWKKT